MQPKTRFGRGGIGRKEKPAGEGIPGQHSLAYNLSNSQWYIQWLRTLRNRGAERVPKNYLRKIVSRASKEAPGFHHWTRSTSISGWISQALSARTANLLATYDTSSPLLQRQAVTPRAAVRIDRVSLSLRNQEFSGRRTIGAHVA